MKIGNRYHFMRNSNKYPYRNFFKNFLFINLSKKSLVKNYLLEILLSFIKFIRIIKTTSTVKSISRISSIMILLVIQSSNKILQIKIITILVLSLILIPTPSISKCEKTDLISGKLISDICWDCVLPIVVSHVKLGNSKNSWIPEKATNKYLCSCQSAEGFNMPGLATSFWEPARLIEFETTPGCLSVLNSKLSNNVDNLNRGTHGIRDKRAGDRAFFHYHYYAFPLLEMLSLFTGSMCNSDGYHDLDVMYFSELDPTWNDDSLAFFVNPEASLVANPIASLACPADAVLSFFHKPSDDLFWCAGSWGHLYPLSGFVHNPIGTLKTTSLLTAKVLAALHRRGIASRTMGNDAMCRGVIDPMLVKSQYKFSLVWPKPETDKAHGFGETTLNWGISRSIPAVGENPVYLIWRWRDCCNTISISGK